MLTDHLQKARDSGKTTGLCLLDMSKAFDKVHHDKLIQDLLAVGISGKALTDNFANNDCGYNDNSRITTEFPCPEQSPI